METRALRESPDDMAMDVDDPYLSGSGGTSCPSTRRSAMKPQQPLALRGRSQQPQVKEPPSIMSTEKKEEKASPPPQKPAVQAPRDGWLHIKVESFTQEEFNELIRLYGAELDGLCIHVTGEVARSETGTLPPCLSFCGLRFPRLESLELRGVDLTFIEMRDWEFPHLLSLEVHHCYAGGIDLMLSSLRDLHLTYVELGSSKDLGPSLARCPALETLSTYKLWGLGGYAHFFTLPACTILDLYRSDDLESLDLFAPRLQSLNLQACYGLERVRLHPHGFNHIKVKSYTNRASRCTGGRQRDLVLKNLRIDEVLATLLQSDGPVITSDGDGPSVLVRLLNARVDPETLEHLRQHPRVGPKAIELFDRDDPERSSQLGGRSCAWEADWLLFGSMGTAQ